MAAASSRCRDHGYPQLWDVVTGRPIGALIQQRDVQDVLFSADGSRMLSWSYDGTLGLWDGLAAHGRSTDEARR